MFRPRNLEFTGSTVSRRNTVRSSNKEKGSRTTGGTPPVRGEWHASKRMVVASDNILKEVKNDQ
jgi:hypothetical protein